MATSTQLILGTATPSTSSTYYCFPYGRVSGNTTESQVQGLVSTAGEITKFYINLSGAPGSGKSYTFTLIKNGTATSCSVTIADSATSGSDTTNHVSVAAGDTLTVRITPSGTPAGINSSYWTINFVPTTLGETLLLSASSCAASQYIAVFGTLAGGATEALYELTAPCSGTLKNLYIKTLAGVNSHTYTVRKNNSNTDLAVTLTGSSTRTGNDTTHTVSVSEGDRISVYRSGDAGTFGVFVGLCFIPDTTGNFILACNGWSVAGSGTFYNVITGSGVTMGTSEANYAQSILACTIKKLYAALSTAPGSGTSYTFTLRKNSADTGLAVTIADANTTGNSATDISLADLDKINNKRTNSGGPASATARLFYLAYIAPTAETKQSTIYSNVTFKKEDNSSNVNADVKFIDRNQATVQADATFKRAGEQDTLQAGVAFKTTGNQATSTSDIYFSNSKKEEINSDVVFKKEGLQSDLQSDVTFKKENQDLIVSDVAFKRVEQSTKLADINFVKRIQSEVSSDVAFLQYKDFYAKIKVRATNQKDFYIQLSVSQPTPVDPTGLVSVDLKTGDAVQLTWTDTGNYGYNIYKDVAGVYTKLNSTPIFVTSYLVGALVTDVTYTFKVVGVNGLGVESTGAITTGTPTFDITRYSGTSYQITVGGTTLVGYCLDSVELVYGPQFSSAKFHIQTRPDVPGLLTPAKQEVKVYINSRLVFTGYLVRRENKWNSGDISVHYTAIDKSWRYTWTTPYANNFDLETLAGLGEWVTISSGGFGGSITYFKWYTTSGLNNRILSQIGAPTGLPSQDTIENQSYMDSTILEVMSSFASSCGNWVIYTDASGNTSYYQYGHPQQTRTYTIGKNILSLNDQIDITDKLDKVIVRGPERLVTTVDYVGEQVNGLLIASAEMDDVVEPSSAWNPAGIPSMMLGDTFFNPAWLKGPNGWKRMGIVEQARYLQDPSTGNAFLAFRLPSGAQNVRVEAYVNKRPEAYELQKVGEQQVEVSPAHLTNPNDAAATWATGTTESRNAIISYNKFEKEWTNVSANIIEDSGGVLVRIDDIPVVFKERVIKGIKYSPLVDGGTGEANYSGSEVWVLEEPWQYIARLRCYYSYSIGNADGSYGSGDIVRTQQLTGYDDDLTEKAHEVLSRNQYAEQRGSMTILGDETLTLQTHVNGLEVMKIVHDFSKGFVTTLDLTIPQNLYLAKVNDNKKDANIQKRLSYSEQGVSSVINVHTGEISTGGIIQNKSRQVRTSEASWGD